MWLIYCLGVLYSAESALLYESYTRTQITREDVKRHDKANTTLLFDADGYYLKQFPILNLTFSTSYFAVDHNKDYITQGSCRQGSAKLDYVADPDVTEQGLGPHQIVSDLVTSDLTKGRYFGFQPYVKYGELYFGTPAHSFEGIVDEEQPDADM